MRKVVVFTLNFMNYGALLQCCALVNYLRGLGVDAESLYLNTPQHQARFRVFAPYSSSWIRQFIYNVFCVLRYFPLKRKIERVHHFRREWLHLNSHPYESEEELLKNPPDADVYISGSDQVFRPEGMNRRVFYLAFPIRKEQKKIAYAVSFGTNTIKPETAKILEPWIRDFSKLSVREESGAALLKNLTGTLPQIVSDPVFLPDESFWKDLACKRLFPGKYIAVYELNGGTALIRKAKEVAKRLHLPVYVLTTKPNRIYPVDKQIYDYGPKEFLSFLQHAEYVVTDSFHGTCFSIIFHVPFTSMVAIKESSDRLVTLLKNIGQEHRLILQDDPVPMSNEMPLTQDSMIRLEKLRECSKAFLKDALDIGE